MRAVALLLLCAAAASAQPTEPEGQLSTVSGHVVNVATGRAVGRTTLRLMRMVLQGGVARYAGQGSNYGASSGPDGSFEFPPVRPGLYRLFASRIGFVDFEYGGPAGLGGQGAILDLKFAQDLADLELRLTPHAVISGRVSDSDGEPVSEAEVRLLRSQYVRGKKVLVLTGKNARTDDRGEYRIYGLSPGQYYLHADPAANNWALTSSAAEGYAPVYYPSATQAPNAGVIQVVGGEEVRADFFLPRERTVQVRGRVLGDESGFGRFAVSFSRQPFHQTPGVTVQSSQHVATVSDQGEFEVSDLTPGTYIAEAFLNSVGGRSSGRVLVEASGAVTEGITIPIDGGRSVQGQVTAEGGIIYQLTMQLVPRDDSFGDSPTRLATGDGGVFQYSGLTPGEYDLEFEYLPAGLYVESIEANGADVTYDRIDLTSGSIENLSVALRVGAGTVSGAVRHQDSGEAAAGAAVVLVPDELQRQGMTRFHPYTTTDQYGRFAVSNVPPGDYHVYAWEEIEESAWMNAEFMRPHRTSGKAVSVDEDSEVGVQLDVIPVEAAGRNQ